MVVLLHLRREANVWKAGLIEEQSDER